MNKNLHYEEQEDLRLGIVTGGSLTRGLDVKLDNTDLIEDVSVGTYVTIAGERHHFLGMITDISLEMVDPMLSINPPDLSNPFLSRVLNGTIIYGKLHILPQLTLSGSAASLLEGPQQVKTIPSHFAMVRQASEQDIARAFGEEDEKHIYIGNPLDMETKVCLDVSRLIERSNGIFGKSGTGKTFLTRILLAEMVQRGNAVNLIFDMHNEYGWMSTSESGYEVKALKQLFPSRVAVFTLDEQSSSRRGVSTDFVVEIGYDEIEPEDISILQETLNITDKGIELVYELHEHYGKKWLDRFLSQSVQETQEELEQRIEVHRGTLQALRRSLSQLKRLHFLVSEARQNSVASLLAYLNRKMNVVLEFGRYRDNILAYVLVANMLTRRIHDSYVRRKEQAMGESADEPVPLIITIEEAHKFLNSSVASQTIFGTIAREMRKYNVTLLVIDQRPGSIDEEVMSQIGTKMSCLLDNEKDIDSVLTGIHGKSDLKVVLSRLETKQQALIFGHAVPMPIVVRVKTYGTPDSYEHYGSITPTRAKLETEDIDDLWG